MITKQPISGQQLRRAAAEAFSPLFSKHRRVAEGRSSLPADFVPAAPDDDNSMAPSMKNGTVAMIPFVCATCSTKATLHRPARFCLKCGKPVRPAESVRDDDPRRVNESDDVTKKLEGLDQLELRRVVGARYAVQPKSSPLTAKSLRADMEALAGRAMRQDAAERAALAAFATKK